MDSYRNPTQHSFTERGCAGHDGAALVQARRLKRRTYPELSGDHGRARLVVLAAEVGGRWSEETRAFVRQLAKAKVQVCASHIGGTRPAGLAASVVLDARVRQCARFRAVFVGPPTSLGL